jgi:hypothetical protein
LQGRFQRGLKSGSSLVGTHALCVAGILVLLMHLLSIFFLLAYCIFSEFAFQNFGSDLTPKRGKRCRNGTKGGFCIKSTANFADILGIVVFSPEFGRSCAEIFI